MLSDKLLEHILDRYMGQRVFITDVAKRRTQGLLRNIRIGTVSHLVVHVYVLERRLPYVPADGTATTRERDVELCG